MDFLQRNQDKNWHPFKHTDVGYKYFNFNDNLIHTSPPQNYKISSKLEADHSSGKPPTKPKENQHKVAILSNFLKNLLEIKKKKVYIRNTEESSRLSLISGALYTMKTSNRKETNRERNTPIV